MFVPRSASHGIHLQVDVLNVAELGEVFLDVGVLGLLGQSADKQLAVILVHNGGHFIRLLELVLPATQEEEGFKQTYQRESRIKDYIRFT